MADTWVGARFILSLIHERGGKYIHVKSCLYTCTCFVWKSTLRNALSNISTSLAQFPKLRQLVS